MPFSLSTIFSSSAVVFLALISTTGVSGQSTTTTTTSTTVPATSSVSDQSTTTTTTSTTVSATSSVSDQSTTLASTTLISTTTASMTVSVTSTVSASASATPTPLNGMSAYMYLGCYNETTGYDEIGNARAITKGDTHVSNTMTAQSCIGLCGNHFYAGLEYGEECWCGQFLSDLSQKLPENSCDMSCSGNANQSCGGRLTLTVYTSKNAQQKNVANSITGRRGLATAAVLLSSMVIAGLLVA